MPETTSRLSNRPRNLDARTGFAKHHLVGANTAMLTLLRDNAEQLDVTSPDMDLAIERTRALLQSSVTLEIVSASVTNGVLEARLKLQNESGHKTPTSYPSRRMWIHFKVTDSSGNVVFESGKINADGSITGADGDANQGQYEPHYDEISFEDQVQIYEPVSGDTDDNVTYTLLRAAGYLKDNRLTPRGFDKLNVPDDVAVRGNAFTDGDFNLGSDEIVYRFPVAVAGELNVTVALNYQSLAYDFIQDLYRDSQLEPVQTFKTMYDAQSLKHELITSAQTTVISDGKADDTDGDGDGVVDTSDNCTLVPNPAQRDTDGDNYGNYCDPDFDNNLFINAADLAYMKSMFFTADPDADLNGNGIVNGADIAILKDIFFGVPGPSGLTP